MFPGTLGVGMGGVSRKYTKKMLRKLLSKRYARDFAKKFWDSVYKKQDEEVLKHFGVEK